MEHCIFPQMTSERPADPLAQENRIAVVVDPALGRGATDNRAAVLATGLAARHPEIIGPSLITADGQELVGFTKLPMSILMAKPGIVLRDLANQAKEAGCTVLVFLARAQGMRSYDAYRASVSETASGDLDVDAVLIYGPKKITAKFVGALPMLR